MKSQPVPGVKQLHIFLILVLFCLFMVYDATAQSHSDEMHRLDNPMTVEYLEANLESQTPRLVLNQERAQRLRDNLQNDPLVQSYYETLKADAARIMEEPFLEREIYDGRRLLAISREMLNRLGVEGHEYSPPGVISIPHLLSELSDSI